MSVSTILRASLLVLVATTMLMAQGDTGGIRGTVLDPSGALIPGAAVTVTKADTGVSYPTVSTAAGNYYVPGLRAGVYIVEVEAPGFKRLIQGNVVVTIAAVVGLDLTLEVGATTETVEVVAALPTLKKETTDISTALDPKTWLDLPVNASGLRSPADLVILSPGVSGLAKEDSFQQSTNGGQVLGTQILIDGIDVSGPMATPGDQRNLRIAPEALQEMTLNTSNYSAEFGNTTGGYLSLTIRSGTNDVHGTLYEFLRNDKLDSREFFAAERGILRQNEYGGTVGGPVFIPGAYDGRNKSFWFFSYRRFITRGAPSGGLASVPTAAFKAGDFSALGNLIYDPATTRSDGAGGLMRDAFPNNIIPTERHSAIGTKALTFYPAPDRAGETENFFEASFNKQFIRSWTTKVDHRFNRTLSVHWSGSRVVNPNTRCLVTCFSLSKVGGSGFFIGGSNQDLTAASIDIMVSPTVLITFSGGANRQDNPSTQRSIEEQPEGGWVGFFGIQNVVGTTGAFPAITIPPYARLGATGGQNDRFNGNMWSTQQSISMVRGKHNIKVGAEQRTIQVGHTFPSNSGFYEFNRSATAFPGQTGTTGYALASMLLGNLDSGTQHIQEFPGGANFHFHSAYIQNDYKMLPNLTWNIGLRWDLYLPMYSTHDNYSIMDPGKSNPAAGGLPGALVFAGSGPGRSGRRRLTPPFSWNNYGPRLGFAWEARPGTVIRSAYGITYMAPLSAGTGSIREYHQGLSADVTFRTQDNGITPAFNFDDGFPEFDKPPFIDPGFGINNDIAMWDSNASEPAYIQQWHFTIQQELGLDWMYEIAYVGSKGTRLTSGLLNPNQLHPLFLSLGSLLTKNINDPDVVAAGFRAPYPGFNSSLAQALRPFPQYNRVFAGANLPASAELGGAQVGNSTYHSLQMKLQKHLSRGLFFLSSYTWAKHISSDTSTMGAFLGRASRDHYNRGLEKGVSYNHTPHRLTTSFAYELPFGPGKPYGSGVSGATAKLIGGWQINGILDYMAGRPLGAFQNNHLPLFNELFDREHFSISFGPRKQAGHASIVLPASEQKLYDGGSFDPVDDRYLNINAFSTAPENGFGDAPSNFPQTRGFMFLTESLGLMKSTPITERVDLEFRFEWFDAFNRHSFGRRMRTNVGIPETFGKVFGTVWPPLGRQGQFALKLIF